jgi:hypothetical protein
MVYNNFDEAITLKHAVIVKGWPLPKFGCPSHVTSCTDIELLYNAWLSGTARFVKLSDDEFEAWHSEHLQHHARVQASLPLITAQDAINPTPGDDVAPGDSANTHEASQPDNPPTASNTASPLTGTVSPLAPSFVNFGADGSMVAPKTRKPRKDKGVPPGPRKGKENQSRSS